MSGIIKAGKWEIRPAVRSAAFNLEDIAGKANEYLDSVRRQATDILKKAQQRAAEIQQEAHRAGLAEAKQQAQQEAEQQLEQRLATLIPALEEGIRQIHQSEQQWLKYWEQQTVHLATAIAEKVIRRELSRHPDITVELVREALELAVGSGRIRVRLHPDDLQTLGSQVTMLVERLQQRAPAEVVADPDIEPGGCCVDTEFGQVDQQIRSQLARLEEELA